MSGSRCDPTIEREINYTGGKYSLSVPALMTTQRLARDWRLPPTGVMLLAILFAGFTLHAHWNAFIQWFATQITLHRYLVMYLLQLNNHQYSGGL
jgi:hypothetical protein